MVEATFSNERETDVGERKSEEEVDMDKVTAAMVLTSLSTSPLVRSPPVKVNDCLNGSWKDGAFTPSSYSSSGYWSWSAPSDQSNPSTPSPPLSADSFKPFRMPSVAGAPDDVIDEPDGSSLLFDEPIPRKRKVSHGLTAHARSLLGAELEAYGEAEPLRDSARMGWHLIVNLNAWQSRDCAAQVAAMTSSSKLGETIDAGSEALSSIAR
ncbi:hypothetical protein JZ751_000327 [Albula glossodonta]|uniref:Uncharacterized protein n=1 Tax=Albula glossodonta TaxID=121402 RepID=A0A8T2PVU0_9TELE|nr:hypothetical protein JZ751_000327 [Albula glossodonta]